jgi:hypothetical protein
MKRTDEMKSDVGLMVEVGVEVSISVILGVREGRGVSPQLLARAFERHTGAIKSSVQISMQSDIEKLSRFSIGKSNVSK